jgi:hypothetical protein
MCFNSVGPLVVILVVGPVCIQDRLQDQERCSKLSTFMSKRELIKNVLSFHVSFDSFLWSQATVRRLKFPVTTGMVSIPAWPCYHKFTTLGPVIMTWVQAGRHGFSPAILLSILHPDRTRKPPSTRHSQRGGRDDFVGPKELRIQP